MKDKILIIVLFLILIYILRISFDALKYKQVNEYLIDIKNYDFNKVVVVLAGGNPEYKNKSKTFYEDEDIKKFKRVIKNMRVIEKINAEDIFISDTCDYYFFNDKGYKKLAFNGNSTENIFLNNEVYKLKYEKDSLMDLYKKIEGKFEYVDKENLDIFKTD